MSKQSEFQEVNMHHLSYQSKQSEKKSLEENQIQEKSSQEGQENKGGGLDIVSLKKDVRNILGNNRRVRFVSKEAGNAPAKKEFRVSNKSIELIERGGTGKVHIRFDMMSNICQKQEGVGDFVDMPESFFSEFGNKIIQISELCAANKMLMYEEK